jgi:hypothetical protein
LILDGSVREPQMVALFVNDGRFIFEQNLYDRIEKEGR